MNITARQRGIPYMSPDDIAPVVDSSGDGRRRSRVINCGETAGRQHIAMLFARAVHVPTHDVTVDVDSVRVGGGRTGRIERNELP